MPLISGGKKDSFNPIFEIICGIPLQKFLHKIEICGQQFEPKTKHDFCQ